MSDSQRFTESVWIKFIKGQAYTQDDELLTEYNNQYNYADEYRKYAKKLNG